MSFPARPCNKLLQHTPLTAPYYLFDNKHTICSFKHARHVFGDSLFIIKFCAVFVKVPSFLLRSSQLICQAYSGSVGLIFMVELL